MRRYVFILTALAVSACGRPQEAAVETSGCARSATHEVSWTSDEAPDVVTTRSEGPTCAQAVVTFVARNARGDPLWAFASNYFDMTAGGAPPEGAPPVSNEQMDQFLANWAEVTQMRTSSLPEWRQDAATLTESAATFAYDTPFDRDTYEMLRSRDLPMICYAAGVEAVQCLIVDPASHAPGRIVTYGP